MVNNSSINTVFQIDFHVCVVSGTKLTVINEIIFKHILWSFVRKVLKFGRLFFFFLIIMGILNFAKYTSAA